MRHGERRQSATTRLVITVARVGARASTSCVPPVPPLPTRRSSDAPTTSRRTAQTRTPASASGGEYGIAWHQYDDATGTSLWTANKISDTSILAIYVSRHDIGGYTHENFKIANSTITAPSPRGGLAGVRARCLELAVQLEREHHPVAAMAGCKLPP
jgi:hypothetical protein